MNSALTPIQLLAQEERSLSLGKFSGLRFNPLSTANDDAYVTTELNVNSALL
jgi:hypothetical protein